jgi:hypothetical protein
MGRVAVWQYVTDPAQRGAADEFSLAVSQQDCVPLRAWLLKKSFPVVDLPAGGVGVRTDHGVVVTFMHHAGGRDPSSGLYSDAVAQAQAQERLAQFGEETLFLAPPEHLAAMELVAGGKEHDRDARRLLVGGQVDLGKLRVLVQAHAGKLGVTKLDLLLDELGLTPKKRR